MVMGATLPMSKARAVIAIILLFVNMAAGQVSGSPGVTGAGGTISSGTQGCLSFYSTTANLNSSCFVIDASAFAGADWVAKMNAAIAVSAGVPVFIPTSLAGASTTVPVLASNQWIIFGQGTFSTSQTFAYGGLKNFHLSGQSTAKDFNAISSTLSYTAATGSLITTGGTGATQGGEIDHLRLTYTNASYANTSNFIDLANGGGFNTAEINIHDNVIFGTGGSSKIAACLIKVDSTYNDQIERNLFANATIAVCGGGITSSNNIRVIANTFGATEVTGHIVAGGTNWIIQWNTMEPIDAGVTTHADFNTNSSGIDGLNFSFNWIGDGGSGTAFAATGGPIFGAAIEGNFIGYHSPGTAINLGGGSGTSKGIFIAGNFINTVTGIDAGSSNPAQDVQVGINYYGAFTTTKFNNTLTGLSSNGPTTTLPGCSTGTFATNTGSVTANIIGSCQIPKGTLLPTSKLKFHTLGKVCTANVTPFAGCTAANTGTCGVKVAWNTSAANSGTAMVNNTVAIGLKWAVDGQIVNSAANVQDLEWTLLTTSASGISESTAAIDTSPASGTDSFIVFVMTNSVAADVCGERWSVEVWP